MSAHAAASSSLVPARRREPLFRTLIGTLALRRSRRALGELDPRLLDDVGLTEAEAHLEARRAAWDVPSTWRR